MRPLRRTTCRPVSATEQAHSQKCKSNCEYRLNDPRSDSVARESRTEIEICDAALASLLRQCSSVNLSESHKHDESTITRAHTHLPKGATRVALLFLKHHQCFVLDAEILATTLCFHLFQSTMNYTESGPKPASQ